jgi:hypothetical protein
MIKFIEPMIGENSFDSELESRLIEGLIFNVKDLQQESLGYYSSPIMAGVLLGTVVVKALDSVSF